MDNTAVFQEQGWSAYTFSHDVLVRCPRCDAPARAFCSLAAKHLNGEGKKSLPRLSCLTCGLTREGAKTHAEPYDARRQDPARDPIFHLPLWLQASCCGGNVLWAYNLEHLTVLEQYVAAKIRQKRCTNCGHDHHQRMTHKLPAWMKSAKHRDEILVTIARLRASLIEPRSPVNQARVK